MNINGFNPTRYSTRFSISLGSHHRYIIDIIHRSCMNHVRSRSSIMGSLDDWAW